MRRTLQSALLLIVPATLAVCPVRGDELAIVTAETGYLLDDQDDVATTVPYYTVLDVDGEAGDYLLVRHDQRKLKIHSGFVHRASQLDGVTDENMAAVREIFNRLQVSAEQSSRGKVEDAVQTAQEALVKTRETFNGSSLEPWILQYQAFLLQSSEQTDRASEILQQCQSLLAEGGYKNHQHAADVLNTLGIVHDTEGRSDEAIKAYERAIIILLSTVGLNHHDTAVIRMNLATAYEKAGDLSRAADVQQLALVTLKNILPASAESLAAACVRLGQLQRDHEDHRSAIDSFETAIRLYEEHHATMLAEQANVRVDLIYSHTQTKNFELAEKNCESLLLLASQMEPENARYYRRDAMLRQGTIDYDREDYEAALIHYQEAAECADADALEFDDAVAHECIGRTLLEMENIEDAIAAMERAIDIYAVTAGQDSDDVLDLRDLLVEDARISFEEAGAYVLAASPKAYLRNDSGEIIETIDGLTVLPVTGRTDDAHIVRHNGSTGYIANTQLHTGRLIPGYGVASLSTLAIVTQTAADALKALQRQDGAKAETTIAKAIELCQREYPGEGSLSLWLKVLQSGILMRTRGPEKAASALEELKPEIEALNPASYPVALDYTEARAAIHAARQEHAIAIRDLTPLLKQATDQFGSQHTRVMGLNRTLGVYSFQSNKHDDAIEYMRAALRIARDAYHADADVVSDALSDLSLALTQTGRFKAAAELLEGYLHQEPKLARDTHAQMVSTLGKAYARLGRTDDARQLLNAVLRVQSKDGAETVLTAPALMAYSELGRLELSDGKWQPAADYFRKALKVSEALELRNKFEASELHRQLATALRQLGDVQGAATELKSVLAIYDILGGSKGPEADDIRKQLRALTAEMMTAQSNEAVAAGGLAQLLNFTPDHEKMFVVAVATAAREAPSESADSVAQLEAGAKIWSLERKEDFCRIYLPESEHYGWVPAAQLKDYSETLMEKGRKKLAEELTDEPESALQECLAAFQRGMAAASEDDLQARIKTLEQSLDTIRSHYKYSNALSALLYEQLVIACEETDDEGKLAKTADESLSHFLSGHGYDHPITAAVRFIRAKNATIRGDLDKSASELSEILKICVKRYGPDDPRTRIQQLGSAANQIRRGFIEDAVRIYTETAADESDDESAVFLRSFAASGLGLLQTVERNFSAASPLLSAADEGYRRLGNPVPSLTVQAAVAAAVCAADQGRPEEALQRLEGVAEMNVAPANQLALLSHRIQRARIATRLHQPDASQRAAEAVEFGETVFGEENFLVANAWQVRGVADATAGLESAGDAFSTARRMAHRYTHEVLPFQSTGRILSFLAEDERRLNEALMPALVDDRVTTAEQSAEWLVNSHNVRSEVLSRVRRAKAMLSEHPRQREFITWENRQRQISEIPLPVQHQDIPEHVRGQIDELRKEAESELKRWPSEVRQLLGEKKAWISLTEIRAALQPDEVLLVFRRVNDPARLHDPVAAQNPELIRDRIYAAWMIPATGAGDVRVVGIGFSQPIEGLVDACSDVLQKLAEASPFETDLTTERKALQQLAGKVWKPLRRVIPATARRLTIVPDGCIHNVPFVALPDSDDKFIIDHYHVRYVLHPGSIVRSEEDTPSLSAPLLLTAPESLAGDSGLTDLSTDEQRLLTARTRGSRFHLNKAELRNAIKAEADLVDQFFDTLARRRNNTSGDEPSKNQDSLSAAYRSLFSETAEEFSGQRASEFRFFSATRPRAIHIDAATWANQTERITASADFISCESRHLIQAGRSQAFNPLMQCGILLSGFAVDKATHHLNDGVLTGEEIVAQDLRGTKLVTLSVAPRAISGKPSEAEAISLLPQAFLSAGAGSVVSGRWPQSALSSRQLLEQFYKQLGQGKSTVEALRAAQLEMRNGGRVPAALWASFHVTGQDLRIDPTKTAHSNAATTPKVESDEARIRTIARGVLDAYRAKDVRKLLSFAVAGEPTEALLKSYSSKSARYRSLFRKSSWRWKAVSAWNGKLPAVYYTKQDQPVQESNADQVHVEFGRADSEVYVVTLVRTDNGWLFDDIHSPDLSDLQTP